jgi:hypothetical protein
MKGPPSYIGNRVGIGIPLARHRLRGLLHIQAGILPENNGIAGRLQPLLQQRHPPAGIHVPHGGGQGLQRAHQHHQLPGSGGRPVLPAVAAVAQTRSFRPSVTAPVAPGIVEYTQSIKSARGHWPDDRTATCPDFPDKVPMPARRRERCGPTRRRWRLWGNAWPACRHGPWSTFPSKHGGAVARRTSGAHGGRRSRHPS